MLTCDCLQAATLLAADSLRRINPSLADLVLRRSQDINIPVVGDETNAYFPICLCGGAGDRRRILSRELIQVLGHSLSMLSVSAERYRGLKMRSLHFFQF